MRILGIGLLLILALGCASYTGTAPTGSSNRISAEELSNCSATNALEAIRLLRPHMLDKIYRRIDSIAYVSGSSRVGSSEVPVYFDGARRTGIESLEHVSISGLKEIRYLEPDDATMRFGTGHAGGAIVIRSH